MFRVVLCALAVLWASPVWAGTWSFSFPPNYCYKINSPNTLAALAEGQPYVSFPQINPSSLGIDCDVPYPYGIVNNISATLTWQSAESDVAKKVGWRAYWRIVRPGQDWEYASAYTEATAGSNGGCYASQYGANKDGSCYVDLSAYYLDDLSVKTLCTDVTCRGYHGEFTLTRMGSSLVTNDSSNPVKLTRINLTAPTSP